MVSSPITSWQIDEEKNGNSSRFYFLRLQNQRTWCLQPEIRRCLLLRRKAMANLDSVLKSRDITLPKNIHLVKAMVFPVVMHGCETVELTLLNCNVGEGS